MLAEYLVDRDVQCPRCAYNLRNGASGICPECGDAIQLGVQLVEPRLGPYISLLVAASLGFGGGTMVILLAMFAGAPDTWWWSVSGLCVVCMSIVFGSVFTFVLRGRRAIRRWKHGMQLNVALTTWVVLVAVTIFFLITFDD